MTRLSCTVADYRRMESSVEQFQLTCGSVGIRTHLGNAEESVADAGTERGGWPPGVCKEVASFSAGLDEVRLD